MSAPPKPWEGAGVNNARTGTGTFTSEMSSGLPEPPLVPDTARPMTSTMSRGPPPIPTRSGMQRSGMGTMGGYGGMGGYSSYGGGGYGGYGGMSSMYGGGMYGGGSGLGGYGGYGGGYGMNRFGGNEGYNTNSFAQQAEESSRQAFQSIESIVQAFGSVAMMLESTFSAVYNSFRAVIGVADHFSRMKMHFAQIFSALAVIRTLRWLYRKLLVLLRLRQGGLEEDLWSKAAETDVSTLLDAEGGAAAAGGKSSWPILMFFAVVLGGPYLIWRLLRSMASNTGDREWASGNADHFVAVAEYEFMAEGEEELSFRRGQKMTVAPKELQPRVRGWLLASVDGKKEGLVPANYVKVLGKRKGRGKVGKEPGSAAPEQKPSTGGGPTPPTAQPGGSGQIQEEAWKTQDSFAGGAAAAALGPRVQDTAELKPHWQMDNQYGGPRGASQLDSFGYSDAFDGPGAGIAGDSVMNRSASEILDKSTKDMPD